MKDKTGKRPETLLTHSGRHPFEHFGAVNTPVFRASTILQPNVAYNGGYTETQKVAGMAQAFNIPIANGGGWPLHNLHTMAGLMNGWRVEYHLGMQEVGERIFVDPPKPEGNIVRVGTKPGVGLEPNFDALDEFQMKPGQKLPGH